MYLKPNAAASIHRACLFASRECGFKLSCSIDGVLVMGLLLSKCLMAVVFYRY